MEGADYLNAIRVESETFSRAARRDLTAAVPSCPGWTVADLVGHLGGVQSWVAGGIEAGSMGPFPEVPGRSGALLDWFDRGISRLVRALENAGTDMPVWTVTQADGVPGRSLWWFRRQTHEAAIHRWDAQAATGSAASIDSEQAIDGIEEFFELALSHVVKRHPEAVGGSLELAPTDSSTGWVIEFFEGRAQVGPPTGKRSQATLRGPASALLLWLWNRPIGSAVVTEGDPGLPQLWRQVAAF